MMFAKKWSFFKIVMVIFVLLSFPGDTAIYQFCLLKNLLFMIQIMKLFVHTIIKILIMKTIVLVNKSGRLYQFFSIRNTKVDALRKMKEPLRRKAMLKLSAFLQKK